MAKHIVIAEYIKPKTGETFTREIGPFSHVKFLNEAMLLLLKKRNVVAVKIKD